MKNSFFLIVVSIILFSCGNSKNDSNTTEKASSSDVVNKAPCDKCGGTLKINEPIFFKSLFPAEANDAVSAHIITLLNDGLIKYDAKTLDFESAIAKRWWKEKDSNTYVFKLNEKAKFHNDPCFKDGVGRVISPEDVIFSFEHLCTKTKTNSSFSGAITKIKGAKEFYEGTAQTIIGLKAIDKNTLHIEITDNSPLFMHFLASHKAVIIPKEAIEKYGLNNHVGSGAFYAEAYPDVNQKFKLMKNANYYRTDNKGIKLPYIDAVEISFIGATPKELNLFKKNQLDLVMGLPINYINGFMKENIDDFEGENPKFVLDASKENKGSELYNLLSVDIKGFYTNRMNYIDLSKVYFEK